MAFLPSRGHLCHPAQRRGRLTTVVKGPAFTRPKWQTWFYLYILTEGLWWRVLRILSETLQGFSRYSLISGIVSIIFFFSMCMFILSNIGKVRGSPTYLFCYKKHWESRGRFLLHSSFEPILEDIYKCFPLKVQDGDWLCMYCGKGLVIVTMKYNSSFLSQPFQMYLFLQATIQNTCCQLVLFSSRVDYLDTPKKHISDAVFFYWVQTCSRHFHKLFTKGHIGSSCSKRAG